MANKINIVISADDKASEPIRRVKGATEELSGSSSKFNKVYSAVAKTTAVVGAAAGAAAGKFVLWDGAMRALNIEDAQAKLKGLGHDGKAVAGIMESALASVKGTAYGLDAAATAAASAVAAGVKPGKDLTNYLKLAADSATIAGVSFGEMGSIFGKVQTQQRAYTMELNQLADRGIPVYQWLQKELGVTQKELRSMVAAGEIDSETYFKAIQKNIGGAALESGKTTRGAWENTKAAMARVGAEIAGDIIPDIRESLGSITSWFDENSGQIASGARNIYASMKLLLTGDFKEGLFSEGIGEDSGLVRFLLNVRDGAIGTAEAIGERLGPKFTAIWTTLTTNLIPALGLLWRQYIEPMIPVIGVTLVDTLGLALDAFNLVATAIGWVATEMANGNPWILTLTGSFIGLGTALLLGKAFTAVTSALNLLTLTTIPGVIGKMAALKLIVSTPMVMPAIAVGAAIAAIASVVSAYNEAKAAVENAANAKRSSAENDIAMIKSARSRYDKGEISYEQMRKLVGIYSKSDYYDGGYTGAGGKYEVAGTVHKGEYVVAKENVDQSTGLPKPGLFGGGGHMVVIQNMNINNGGDYNRLLSDIGFALETAS